MPGSRPHRKGLTVSSIAKGKPAGQRLARDRAFLQVGSGGHGSDLHCTSCSWQVWPRGHSSPSQGSRQRHTEQPVSGSRANPEGQNMRHAEAAQCFGSEQLTPIRVSFLLPGNSTPYSSTHQQLLEARSSWHWIRSKSPFFWQRGTLTDGSPVPVWRALALLVSALLKCWQAVRLAEIGRRTFVIDQ